MKYDDRSRTNGQQAPIGRADDAAGVAVGAGPDRVDEQEAQRAAE